MFKYFLSNILNKTKELDLSDINESITNYQIQSFSMVVF